MFAIRTAAVLLALFALAPALAADLAPGVTAVAPVFTTTGRPRIGLVLGGGGAKGFAHIGVLKELERRHIPIDVIAGTSMGAVVGSVYATGADAAGVERIARSIDWTTVFNDSLKRRDLSFRRKLEDRQVLLDYRIGIENGKPVLPRGVLGGQKLYATVQALLAPWAATDDFNDLAIPYRAVATDIASGEPVVMGQGSLTSAVFASMSIPAAFAPVERDGRLLVDGSLSNNLPVDVARAMGVDVVIVVDVGDQPKKAERINSAVDVFAQMQLLLGWEAIKRQRDSLKGRDVLIEPDITGLSVTAFDKLDMTMARGEAATQAMGDKLAALSVSDAQWALYVQERASRSHPAPIRIDRVIIANTSTLPQRALEPLITTRPGDLLNGPVLQRQVAKLYALDRFDRVQYTLSGDPGDRLLTFEARGARGSQRYGQFGLMLGSDFGRNADFALAFGFTDRDFLGTGAEWRGFARVGSDVLFDVNLYKPFGRFFVEPTAYYRRYSSLLIQNGATVATNQLQVISAGTGIDAGMVFGNWGELRAGVRIGGVNPADGNNLVIAKDSGWNTDADWRIGFTYDTLDSPTFPTRGGFGQIRYIDHVGWAGSEFTRTELLIQGSLPLTRGRNTLVLSGRLGITAGSIDNFVGSYPLGGFLNLSGLPRNGLLGQQVLLLRAAGFRRLGGPSPIFDLPVYVGASIEAGNAWNSQDQISLGSLRTGASVFVASDTPIGPLWLAYGRSGSNGSIYLVLGRVF